MMIIQLLLSKLDNLVVGVEEIIDFWLSGWLSA